MILGNETSIIADLQDLKEVLSITQNFEGIPKYKIDYFDNIFSPLYKSKTEPDSNTDNTKKEEREAVTVRQLCIFYKEKTGKSINTDNMKKTYLNELINNGLIDYESSKIDSRQYIYYPVVESPKNPPSVTFNNNHIDNISPLSNLNQFDNFSQSHVIIYKKIINYINETWIFSEIIKLLRYRIDFTNIKGPLADYLNNHEDFQFLDNNHCFYNVDKEEKNLSFQKI